MASTASFRIIIEVFQPIRSPPSKYKYVLSY
jgi:hypothetical protein